MKRILSLFLLAGLSWLHPGIATAQQKPVVCNVLTDSACNINSDPGNLPGDPAWIAFGKINANETQLYSMFGNGTVLQTTGSASYGDLLNLWAGTKTASYCLSGVGTMVACSGASTPGGSNYQIQWNNSGALAGISNTAGGLLMSTSTSAAPGFTAVVGDCTLNYTTGAITCTTSNGSTIAVVAGTPTSGQLATFSSANTIGGTTVSGDCTLTGGSLNCTKTAGTAFGTFATQNYASPPAIGGTTPAAGAFTTVTATTPIAAGSGGTGAASLAAANIPVQTGTITPGDCVSWSSGTVVTDAGAPCGSGGGGSPSFNTITSGANSTASMVVQGSASLTASGTGVIGATSAPFSGLTPGTNTAGAMVIGAGSSLSASGGGTIDSTQTNGSPFGTFATQNFATPPAIGGATPNAGAFSSITLNSPLSPTSGGIGAVSLAAAGLPTISGTPTTNDCVKWASSSTLGDAGPCGGGSGGVSGIYTYAQLAGTYNASNITGNPTVSTSDTGPAWWTGSVWAPTATFTVAQAGIPIGVAPSGTVGANGSVTFNTALDQVYSSIYMSFPAGALFANSPLGMYYLSCSSVTVCTAYNNLYFFGNPKIPTSPTAISSASIGAYTQNLSCGSNYCAAILLNGVLPASPYGSLLGNNGEVKWEWTWRMNSSANSKGLSEFFTALGGGSTGQVNVDTETTAGFRGGIATMRSRGVTNSLVSVNNGQGDVGTGTAFNATELTTTRQQTVSFKGWTGNTNDWLILESGKITATSSLIADQAALFVPTPASASIVPAPAAQAGYTNNLFFIRPALSDLSFSNAPTTALYAALYYSSYSSPGPSGYSMTSTPYTPSGQVLTIAGGLGGNSYAPVVTQRANSTAGLEPYITASTGFYAEYEFWLSDNNPDHWPAVWMLPKEHSTTNQCTGPNSPTGYECYGELDVNEGGLQTAVQGQAQFHGPQQTLNNWWGYAPTNTSFTVSCSTTTAGALNANWTGPTGTETGTIGGTAEQISVTQNSNSAAWGTALGSVCGSGTAVTFSSSSTQYTDHSTAPYDWTIPHRFGVLYNPTAKTVSYYMDEVLQNTYSTSTFDYAINPYHYYMIANGSSRGLNIPYSMYVSFMGVWTPTAPPPAAQSPPAGSVQRTIGDWAVTDSYAVGSLYTSEIAALAANPGAIGYAVNFRWNNIEDFTQSTNLNNPASPTVQYPGLATIATIFNYLQAHQPGMPMAIYINGYKLGATVSSPPSTGFAYGATGIVPTWIGANASVNMPTYYGSATTTNYTQATQWGGGYYGVILDDWNGTSYGVLAPNYFDPLVRQARTQMLQAVLSDAFLITAGPLAGKTLAIKDNPLIEFIGDADEETYNFNSGQGPANPPNYTTSANQPTDANWFTNEYASLTAYRAWAPNKEYVGCWSYGINNASAVATGGHINAIQSGNGFSNIPGVVMTSADTYGADWLSGINNASSNPAKQAYYGIPLANITGGYNQTLPATNPAYSLVAGMDYIATVQPSDQWELLGGSTVQRSSAAVLALRASGNTAGAGRQMWWVGDAYSYGTNAWTGTDVVVSGEPNSNWGGHGISWTLTQPTTPYVTATVPSTLSALALTVSATTLPNGTHGSAYSQPITVSGGTGPYTWSMYNQSGGGSASLSSSTGSSVNLNFTPPSVGSYYFWITIVDSSTVPVSYTARYAVSAN